MMMSVTTKFTAPGNQCCAHRWDDLPKCRADQIAKQATLGVNEHNEIRFTLRSTISLPTKKISPETFKVASNTPVGVISAVNWKDKMNTIWSCPSSAAVAFTKPLSCALFESRGTAQGRCPRSFALAPRTLLRLNVFPLGRRPWTDPVFLGSGNRERGLVAERFPVGRRPWTDPGFPLDPETVVCASHLTRERETHKSYNQQLE